MSWDFTDTLLVRLRDHPIECSETGGTPQDDFLQLDLFIPKPVQADGVWSLTVGNDGPSSTAIRVSHPDTGVLTQQTSGTEGLLCLTVIDDAHVVGTLEMDLEFVTVHGAFEADICTPP
ncbi:MAG: hypothetical protein H6Q90_4176 [Deltaproteobacteria bacterium]|nr:hypothetical protein [Deltaproteobacteria bacterium]